MTDTSPEKRLVDESERIRRPKRYDIDLFAIPSSYLVAGTCHYLFGLNLIVALAVASVLASGVVAEMLFFHPSTECERT